MLKWIIIAAAIAVIAYFAWPYVFPVEPETTVHDPAYDAGAVVDSLILPAVTPIYANPVQSLAADNYNTTARQLG